MTAEIVYYIWATCLLLVSASAWGMTLFTLPGNWIIVGATALFAYFYPAEDGRGVSWTVVGVLVAMAVLGELVELAAGAAGAAKHGASRRAMALSVVGTILGSVVGAVLLSATIPIVGTIVGAVGGGALGAFAGAYLGEVWKGSSSEERMTIGTAAMVGRILGTVGKLAVGATMVIIASADAFF